jgi:aryl-alcohol dehydrogenase-like predicted oxidoreductase
VIVSKIKHRRIISQLCFGTVQLGLPYGIANQTGMPDEASARDLLFAALHAGVTLFDTARGYGESEARLGQALAATPATVMTKLSPLADLTEHDSDEAASGKTEESIRASLHCLGLSFLPYVLLHRAQHLHSHGGAIWRMLLRLREQGIIERLGVSVQNPEEALAAIQIPEIECLQLPYNILDRRYENAHLPDMLLQRPDILVIARSALLQGLLVKEADAWPCTTLAQAEAITTELDRFVIAFGRKNRVDLCLAFVRAQRWIDSVVVGMENSVQLAENLEMFQSSPLDDAACNLIKQEFP